MSFAVVLLCIFTVSRSRGWTRRGGTFSLGWGLLWWSIQSTANGLSCNHPCSSAQCSHIDTTGCPYGLVIDSCGCCNVCGRGLGQLCGGIDDIEGKCGPGLECVLLEEEGLSQAELNQLPGLCQQMVTGPSSSTTVMTVTTVTTPRPVFTSSSELQVTDTPPQSTIPAEEQTHTESKKSKNCRGKCSVDYCNGRARICSAEGLEYFQVQGRNRCQHTSCHACYMLVRPNCEGILCTTDPPTKTCLRKFYDCVRQHYFRAESSEALLLKLNDPRARDLVGRIMCHIPLLDSVEPNYMNYGPPDDS